LVNGGYVSGATSSNLVVANMQFPNAGTYQVIVSNSYGTQPSAATAVTVVPIATFNGNGAGWVANGSAGSGLPIWNPNGGNNALELTQNQASQTSSAFFPTPLYIGAFKATFSYQLVTPTGSTGNPADGAAFIIQNDPRGASALGGGGGSLGYANITKSAALEFNVFRGPSFVGISFDTNGAIGPFLSPNPVQIDDGNPINVTVTYASGVAHIFLQDSVLTNDTYTGTANVNLPAVTGTNMAYVGFSGATGGSACTQVVSNFTFISYLDLNATPSADGNSIVLTWPTGVGDYTVQRSSSLVNPVWTPYNPTITLTNGMNQVVVPLSGSSQFYQLNLVP
jgi:hypothetical protein